MKLKKWSKLRKEDIEEILKSFANGETATKAAKQLQINRHTIDDLYKFFREKLAQERDNYLNQMSNWYVIDTSFYSSYHDSRKKSLHISKKISIIYVLVENGRITSVPIYDDLRPIIKKVKLNPDVKSYPRIWHEYLTPIINGYKFFYMDITNKQIGIQNTTSTLDRFAEQLKAQIRKYNGVSRKRMFFYLCEFEYRLNYRKKINLYPLLRQIVFPEPINSATENNSPSSLR